MQIVLNPSTLFGDLRSYEALIVFAIVQGLNDSSPIEVKLCRGAVDIPIVCPHIRHELCSRLTTAFDEQLPSPWMRYANEEIVCGIWTERSGYLGEGV